MWEIIVFCYINLVCTKGFDTIIFRFPGAFKFGKWESSDNFATRDEVEGVNLSQDSQFFKRDDSMKMETYSGKTLSPANLSNEYNRILFLIFHSRGLFPNFGQCTKQLQECRKIGKIKKRYFDIKNLFLIVTNSMDFYVDLILLHISTAKLPRLKVNQDWN